MSKSDQFVIIITSLLIILHISVLIAGYRTHKFPYFAAYVNLAMGAFAVVYWITRQLQVQQHIFDTREIVVLVGEVIVIGAAIFYIVAGQRYNLLKGLQYVFFWAHLIAAVG